MPDAGIVVVGYRQPGETTTPQTRATTASAALSVSLAITVLIGACTRPPPPDVTAAALPRSDGVGAPFDPDAAAAGLTDTAGAASDAPADSSGVADTAPTSAGDAAPTTWLADGACTPGQQICLGVQLATCSSVGDGWSLSPCYPGQYCDVDHCVAIENNLIIAFDTSGSMNAMVPGSTCAQKGYPDCAPSKGCSRMDASKTVFLQALKKVDTKFTRLALFRFPQRIAQTSGATCAAGYYAGFGTLSGDTTGAQSVTTNSAWYWDSIHEIRCVAYPGNKTEAQLGHLQIGGWMDGEEALTASGDPCGGGLSGCVAAAKCGAGACCDGACVKHAKPELRAHGGTPIGKTLFYIGEYLRHRVVVDGLPCVSDAGCANPNYHCEKGLCTDRARSCRATVVVLFTDGGEANDPTNFFSPRVAAQRLAFGLACGLDSDCVGGASCQGGRCLPPSPTGFHCVATGTPCKTAETNSKSALFCPGLMGQPGKCLPDLLSLTKAQADAPLNNVLRSPDGRPFGVRVHVVDISDNPDPALSYYLARAGRGRLFTASSADPLAFVNALESAFDMKNKTVCGTKL